MIIPIKKFTSEFKKFALKANFVDMAVGIIIAIGFNNVMNSIIKDCIMPFFALLTDKAEFSDMKWVLRPVLMEGDKVVKAAVEIRYGQTLEFAVDFLVIALVMYFVVKGYNLYKARREDPEDEREETPQNIQLLKSIDESLKKLADKQ